MAEGHEGAASSAPPFSFTAGSDLLWTLGNVLDSGAFATVYACHSSAGDHAASKVSTLANLSAGACARALTEAKLWRSLGQHPYVVSMLTYTVSPEKIILVLEHATGGNLFDRISRPPLLESDAARWVSQLLLAVDFLHATHGIVHRDIKPDNLLLASSAPDAPLKLADFGTAKQLLDPSGSTRTPCGTLAYAAPEQVLYLRGQLAVTYGRAADLWSVGITAYAVLSGLLPFSPKRLGWVRSVPGRIAEGEGEAPMELSFPEVAFSTVSAPAKAFVAELLQLDPARRPSANAAQSHAWLTQWQLLPGASGLSTASEHEGGEAASACAAVAMTTKDWQKPHAGGSSGMRPAQDGKSLQPPPLSTPELLRGLAPQQFAAHWDHAARVSAAWLQRKQSPRQSTCGAELAHGPVDAWRRRIGNGNGGSTSVGGSSSSGLDVHAHAVRATKALTETESATVSAGDEDSASCSVGAGSPGIASSVPSRPMLAVSLASDAAVPFRRRASVGVGVKRPLSHLADARFHHHP